MRCPKILLIAAWIWVATFLTGCLAIPLGVVIARVFSSHDGTLSVWTEIFDPDLLAITWATLWQASMSTLLSVLLGVPLGLWIGERASRGERGSRLCKIFLALPYGVPTVVVGTAAVLWLGRSGILARVGLTLDIAYSLKAVVLAHVFLNTPWVALLVAQGREQVPLNQLEAASTLGASTSSKLRWILWPNLKWVILSSGVQVFSLCVMSFALVLLLGGGPPVQTLETALYAKIRYGSLDLRGALICALWQLVLTLTPWAVIISLQAKKETDVTATFSKSVSDGRVLRKNRSAPFLSRFRRMGLPVILCTFFTLPYLALCSNQPWSILAQAQVFEEWKQPALLSFKLAALSSSLAVMTAIGAILVNAQLNRAKADTFLKSFFLFLLSLPSGVSMLVLGLGFWLAYGKWIDPFEGSLTAMVLLQMTTLFPLAFRALWPVALKSQKSSLEAAQTLGASSLQAFWYIEWPRWRGPLLGILAMTAGVAIGEVASVSLFYSENLIPLPLLVARWMAQYRFEEAQAVAALLLLLTTGTIGAVLTLGTLERAGENK